MVQICSSRTENTQFNDFTKHSDDAVSTPDRSKDEDQTRSRNSKTIGRGNRGDIHRKSFSSGLDEKGKKEEVPLRSAYSQAGRCGMQPKAIFACRRS
ncbi:hypothetical protein TNCV_402841 [Trichonephila clavipes]|nr:hypothetical protein TNCV_402841 [Trichonephila clavipes]